MGTVCCVAARVPILADSAAPQQAGPAAPEPNEGWLPRVEGTSGRGSGFTRTSGHMGQAGIWPDVRVKLAPCKNTVTRSRPGHGPVTARSRPDRKRTTVPRHHRCHCEAAAPSPSLGAPSPSSPLRLCPPSPITRVSHTMASLNAQCKQVFCLVEMAPSAPSRRPPRHRDGFDGFPSPSACHRPARLVVQCPPSHTGQHTRLRPSLPSIILMSECLPDSTETQ